MPLPDLYQVASRMLDRKTQRNAYPNGVICLKGGDLAAETAKFKKVAEVTDISLYFTQEFFKDKKTVYVQI